MKTQKPITIVYRTALGWSAPVLNSSKTHCDRCGEKLWVSPAKERYCNGNGTKCEVKS